MDYALISGAGGRAWYWHLIVPRLGGRGHQALAGDCQQMTTPRACPTRRSRSLTRVSRAAGRVVVVATSRGAFTAPLVAGPLVAAAVLVNPMSPVSGETSGAWWGDTGAAEARAAGCSVGYSVEFDPAPTLSATWPRRCWPR